MFCLFQVCDALRYSLDEVHEKRLETVEKKVKLKTVVQRDPSNKVYPAYFRHIL